jgi:hypothetical protein
MKIIITGATGLIGKSLCKKITDRNDDVIVFTRKADNAKKALPFIKEFVEWDYTAPEGWEKKINGADCVIHLAGANLFEKRWNKSYKKTILESRKFSTKCLVNAIIKAEKKPSTFICASAVGYYGDRANEILVEEKNAGNDFLAKVCKAWEDEAKQIEETGLRRVSIRTGVVLSSDEGALKQMLSPFQKYIGGPLGNGKQWFPWIHIDDLVNIFIYTIDNNLTGAVNASSPNPVKMKEFARTLGKVLHKPSLFNVPELALRIVVGEGAKSIRASLRVIPEKLIQNKFDFKFGNLKPALENLLK